MRTTNLILFLGLSLGSNLNALQGPPPGSREAMWPAPTAEDWAKPVPIQWQRTFEDAIAVSKQTNRPILVCVNMDGEIASEHYAGIRYRQPEIAALYQPYVCVIASVYRHTPRDYDEHGQRIPCPRFGTVTCGEHIALEPILYERFLDGERVAPRHIMVELDQSEVYDVYYALDTQSVFDRIEKGFVERGLPVTEVPTDIPVIDMVASPDSQNRETVERAYLAGDRAVRTQILQRAIAAGKQAPVDVLRLAIYDVDVELSQLARRALLTATSEGSIDLIARALRAPMSAEDRDALIGALERLGKTYPRAETLAVVFRGLAADAGTVDVRSLSTALLEVGPRRTTRSATVDRVTEIDQRSLANPSDAEAHLELAEATLSLAKDPRTEAKYARLSLEDVRKAAHEAERLGAYGWRANAALAIAEYRLDRLDESYRRAEMAVTSMPKGVVGEHTAEVLGIFGEARRMAITKAVQNKEEWPAQWLNDVNQTYGFLVEHEAGTVNHVVAHHDFLVWLGAKDRATSVLDTALKRFGESAVLHDRLRTRLLRTLGPLGLEEYYADWLERDAGATPGLPWFAGYASMVTAEYQRRFGRRAEADGAYDRARAHFATWVERVGPEDPTVVDTARHYDAMCYAGRARNALDEGELENAWAELGSCFEAREASAANLDGMGFSAVATLRMLISRSERAGLGEIATAAQAKLDALDPELLLPAPYDRVGPRWQNRGRRRGR